MSFSVVSVYQKYGKKGKKGKKCLILFQPNLSNLQAATALIDTAGGLISDQMDKWQHSLLTTTYNKKNFKRT